MSKLKRNIVIAIFVVVSVCCAILFACFQNNTTESEHNDSMRPLASAVAEENHNHTWVHGSATAISLKDNLTSAYFTGGTEEAPARYYLNNASNSKATETIEINGYVELCFNGLILYNQLNKSVIKINEGATLVLYDCSAKGTGYIWNGYSYNNGPTITEKGAAINIYKGTLIMNGGGVKNYPNNNTYAVTSGAGGGVYMSGGSFIMNAGTISGIKSSGQGGGVYNSGGSFEMNGGTITDISASAYGGGVYVNYGTFTMNGGSITGISAGALGGGVYLNSSSFEMKGGSISNITSTTSGAGLYMTYATSNFTMRGGSITGNTASPYGGGVHLGNGSFKMYGGEISGNILSSSSSRGGGIYMTGGSFEMNGGEISGNEAARGGGLSIENSSCTVTLNNGGVFSDNLATSSTYTSGGGGVFISTGSLTIDGTVFTGNKAGSNSNGYGSAVHVYGGTFGLNSGTFTNNGGSFGTLCIENTSGTYTLTDSVKINNNTGIGLYLSKVSGSLTLTGGIKINNNTGYGIYAAGCQDFTLNIEDAEIVNNSNSNVYFSQTANNMQLNISGGRIAYDEDFSGSYRCVYLFSTSNVSGATFTMTDGEIVGRGLPALDISKSGCTTTITGGKISNIAPCLQPGGCMNLALYSGELYIDGLTFENNILGELSNNDGGAVIRTTSYNATIKNCKFFYNKAPKNEGGSIYYSNGTTGSEMYIENCEFYGCGDIKNPDAQKGGAIGVYNNRVTLKGCTFSDLTASDMGGAVCGRAGSVFSFEDCKFYNNMAPNGGAVAANGHKGGASMSLDDMVACTITMTGCIFEGNSATKNGGSIDFEHNFDKNTAGTLTMDGCTLDGSGAASAVNAGNSGGGVYVAECDKFEMINSTVKNCSSGTYGGGVYVSAGSFSMDGSSKLIANVSNRGGGAYFERKTSLSKVQGVEIYFNLVSGSEISGNTAYIFGGGIYLNYSTSLMMTGGTITDNEAGSCGGGVYYYGDSARPIKLSGVSKITGNTLMDKTVNNLYLSNYIMTVAEGGLEEGAQIGVTISALKALPYTFVKGGSEYQKYFFSDNLSYCVYENSGEGQIDKHTDSGTGGIDSALSDDTYHYYSVGCTNCGKGAIPEKHTWQDGSDEIILKKIADGEYVLGSERVCDVCGHNANNLANVVSITVQTQADLNSFKTKDTVDINDLSVVINYYIFSGDIGDDSSKETTVTILNYPAISEGFSVRYLNGKYLNGGDKYFSVVFKCNGDEYVAHVNVTVAKLIPTVEASYDTDTYVYAGGELPAISATATYEGEEIAGTISWDYHGTLRYGANQKFTWTWTPKDSGYEKVTGFFILSVGKKVVSFTAEFDADGETIYTNDTLEKIAQYITLTVTYSDESTGTLTEGFTLTIKDGDKLTSPSTTITVTYDGKTYDITVPVSEVTLERIEVEWKDGEQTQTFYTSDEIEKLKDYIKVIAYYDNGSDSELNSSDYTLSGTFGTAGTQTITVKVNDTLVQNTINVTVTAVALESFKVHFNSGDIKIYTSNNLDDLKEYISITDAKNNDGSNYAGDTSGFTLSTDNDNKLVAGSVTVYVTLDGVTEQISVTVYAVELDHIVVSWKDGEQSETFYTSNTVSDVMEHLKVTGVNNDGSEFEIEESYTVSPEEGSKLTVGMQIKVSYGGHEDSIGVDVTEVALVGIKLEWKDGEQSETFYESDTVADVMKHLIITGVNNDGSEFEIEEGYTVSPEEGSKLTKGTMTITVTYGDHQDTTDVEVTEVLLVGIELEWKDGNQPVFYESNTVADVMEYVVVKGIYNDGSKETISGSYTVSPEEDSKLTVGMQIEVTYGEHHDTLDVDVTEVVLVGIRLEWKDETQPVFYETNTVADVLEHIIIKGINNDGSEFEIDGDYTVSPDRETNLSGNPMRIEITYREKTASISVTLSEIVLTSIEVEWKDGEQSETFYTSDSLNKLKDYIKVTAHYNNGTQSELDGTDYTLDGTFETAGEQMITVKVNETDVQNTIQVTVTAVALESFEVEFDSDGKTIYTSNSLDDLRDYISITNAKNNDGTDYTGNTDGFTLSTDNDNKLDEGSVTVYVTLGGVTRQFTVTVKAVELDHIELSWKDGSQTKKFYTSNTVSDVLDYLKITGVNNDGSEFEIDGDYTVSPETDANLTVGSLQITVTYREKEASIEIAVSAMEVAVPTVRGEYVYNGEEQEAELSGYDADVMSKAYYTEENGSEPMDGAPVNAGTYWVKIELVDDGYKWAGDTTDAVWLSFTIEKADINLDGVRFEGTSHEHDGTGKSISVIAESLPEGVRVESYTYMKDGEEDSEHAAVGTYTVIVKFTLDSEKASNYNVPADMEITMTISESGNPDPDDPNGGDGGDDTDPDNPDPDDPNGGDGGDDTDPDNPDPDDPNGGDGGDDTDPDNPDPDDPNGGDGGDDTDPDNPDPDDPNGGDGGDDTDPDNPNPDDPNGGNGGDTDPDNPNHKPGDGDDDDNPAPDDSVLESKKSEAKEELDEFAKEKKREIDGNADLSDEKKQALKEEVDGELQKGLAAIDGATDADGVDSSFNAAKKNIEDIGGLSGGGGSFPWEIIAIAAAVLALFVLAIVLIKKRQTADGDDYYDDEYDYDDDDEDYDDEDDEDDEDYGDEDEDYGDEDDEEAGGEEEEYDE